MLKPFEKYQFKPFFGSSHHWAENELKSIKENCRVLDIGSGPGAIGKLLKDQGINEIYAVEVDAETRELIKDVYIQSYPSLDQVPSSLKVDCILLLDVLEHTPDPLQFLKQALSHLSNNGTVLISVPNIAHWSIRILLLFGYFQYTERGLLDKTHLHFFTRSHLLDMINQIPELQLESTSASIEPLEFLVPEKISDSYLFKKLAKFRLGLADTLPGLFAYQHLVRVVKR